MTDHTKEDREEARFWAIVLGVCLAFIAVLVVSPMAALVMLIGAMCAAYLCLLGSLIYEGWFKDTGGRR